MPSSKDFTKFSFKPETAVNIINNVIAVTLSYFDDLQVTSEKFWTRHPALLYGLSALLGAYSAIDPLWLPYLLLIIIPIILFCIPGKRFLQTLSLRFLLALILGLSSFYLTKERYQFPPSNESEYRGTAEVEFSSVSSSKTHFGPMWTYQGTLLSFIHQASENPEIIARNLPIRLTIPLYKYSERPLATQRYLLQARLKDSGNGRYVLSPLPKTAWHKLKQTWSLAEIRAQAKSTFQEYIQKSMQDSHVSAFLMGIATGEFDDLQLSFELGRFGLQHLMAVSGLHFSIIASLLGFGLSLIFRKDIVSLFLIGLLTIYFIFLGSSSSVLRAWIAITIALSSLFFKRRSLGLNSLGAALLVIAIWDPLLVKQIAFQFSFGVTASILLWFEPCDKLLQKVLFKRRLSQVVDIGWLDQHAYCLMVFLRQAIALSIAVNLVAFPLTIYHFHQFPLLGLLYNLFIPFMVSFSMMFLLLACMTSPFLPWVGNLFHSLNESYTQFLLNLAFNLPKFFDYTFYMNNLTENLLVLYLIFIFFIGIFNKKFNSLQTTI